MNVTEKHSDEIFELIDKIVKHNGYGSETTMNVAGKVGRILRDY